MGIWQRALKCALLWALALFLAAACSCTGATAAYGDERVLLSVIMYHSVLKDPASTGEYVVTPDTFEADMRFLKQNGYTAVFPSELIAYVHEGGALPANPVLITLDDGHYNNLSYVLPILEELDMKATVAVVGEYAQRFTESPDPNPAYAYLSWAEIAQLAESGHVEIANHSYAMHSLGARRGSSRMAGEGVREYRAAFTEDTLRLQEALLLNANVECNAYAYPFGLIGEGSGECLRELGIMCSFSCREQVNELVPNDPDCLFGLGRFNRPGGVSTWEFMQRVLP